MLRGEQSDHHHHHQVDCTSLCVGLFSFFFLFPPPYGASVKGELAFLVVGKCKEMMVIVQKEGGILM